MRNEFLEGCESVWEAYQACPWAEVIIEVDGGYKAFESADDYDSWCKQQ